MRRGRGHGARDTLLVLALGTLAVVAALAWLAEHLAVLAGCVVLIGVAYYPVSEGAHDRVRSSRSRRGQKGPQPPRQRPAGQPDRGRLLADPLSGVRPFSQLWRPS